MLQYLIIASTLLIISWLYFRSRGIIVPPGAYKVADGDGINIDGNKIRILGFDAPEWNQPGGKEATAALGALIQYGFTLKISGRRDRYGRTLARLIVKRRWLGLQLTADVTVLMLRAGHGHSNARGRQWLSAYGRAELYARLMQRGLWANTGFMGWRALNPKYWRKNQPAIRAFTYQTGNIKRSGAPRHAPLPRFKPKRPMFPRDL